jgi:hypothetical protein
VTGWNPFDEPGRSPRLPAPSTSHGPVDPELAATLGVLRRSQTDADRGASVTRAARGFSASGGYRGAKVGGIRVLDPEREIVLIPFVRGPVPLDSEGRPVPGFDPATFTNVACLFEATGNGVGGVGCHTAAKIRSGRAIATHSGRVTGLVPDGVARVRLVRGGQVTDAAVANNLFVADAEAPQRIDWLSEDGAVVRRIDLAAAPPTP